MAAHKRTEGNSAQQAVVEHVMPLKSCKIYLRGLPPPSTNYSLMMFANVSDGLFHQDDGLHTELAPAAHCMA